MDESFTFDASSQPLLPKYTNKCTPPAENINDNSYSHPQSRKSIFIACFNRCIMSLENAAMLICVYLGFINLE